MSKGPRHTKAKGAGQHPAPGAPDRAALARAAGAGRHPELDLAASAHGTVLLSACLIVKDEEQSLPDCLASVRRLVDEVVVYDTGSTDRTVELARRAGARVIEGYWDDDFGRARNASLEHCRGEWVLWIDADERFVCGDQRELRGALESGQVKDYDALLVEIHNLAGDGTKMGNIHRAFRLFRRSSCHWYGALHEQVDVRPGRESRVRAAPLNGAHIKHLGYMDDIVRDRGKLARNLRLAEAELTSGKGQPDGVAELNVGRALAALGRYPEAQPHLDTAVRETTEGAPRRAALLYNAHNLAAMARHAEALASAHALADICEIKGLAHYLEGFNLRRLGRPHEAIDVFSQIGEAANEDGFALPQFMVRAEMAGAMLEAGRTVEAADWLILLIQEDADVVHLTAAFKVFALTGKSIESLMAALPEDRLDKVAAALVLVPPVVADQMAEGLWARFGARPQLLAAAIRFAPMVPVARALDWSARLRAIGMAPACPLMAQACLEVLEPVERLRAALTAHAAFGDQAAAELALAIIPGVARESLGSVLSEASLLDPPLVADLAAAARKEGAPGVHSAGLASARAYATDAALARLGGQLAPTAQPQTGIRSKDGSIMPVLGLGPRLPLRNPEGEPNV